MLIIKFKSFFDCLLLTKAKIMGSLLRQNNKSYLKVCFLKLNFDQAGLIKLNRKVREVLRKGRKGAFKGKKKSAKTTLLLSVVSAFQKSQKLKRSQKFSLSPDGSGTS